VAADANSTGDMYPDQSLYACNSGPDLARRINKSLLRSDVIEVLFSDYVFINRSFSRSKKRVFVTIGCLVLTGLDKSVETVLVEGSPQWLTDLTTRF